MKFSFITILVLGFALNSCNEFDGESNNVNRVDIDLTDIERDIATRQYDFPVNLLLEAAENRENENVMISPASASIVIGMILNATDKDDREEILDMLNIGREDTEDYNSYIKKLLNTLPFIDPKTVLNINNSFWHHSANIALSDSYRQLLDVSYSSEINSYDSFNISAVNDINNWVKTKTGEGIARLLDEKDVDMNLNTVWINTVNFNGVWRQKFDKSKTEKKPFYTKFPDMSVSEDVDMMYGNKFHYRHFYFPERTDDYDDAITSVMLTYGNESFIFHAILPSVNNPDISATLKSLDRDYWRSIDKECSYEKNYPGDVTVYLPKMHNETTENLIPYLQAMGLSRIFDEQHGVSMSQSLNVSERQTLRLFRQNIVFDVDEEGAELKVATSSGGGHMSALPPAAIEFNRPFIYFVRERSTGTVLLAGVYQHPE